MSNKVDIVLENTEISESGLRKFTVRMINSDKPKLSTNEIPQLLNAIRQSRYDALSQYTLHFAEEEHLYDPDNFVGTLTIVCKYGVDDITQTLRMEDIEWERISKDSDGTSRTESDAAWNILHTYQRWQSGRTVLTLSQQDLDAVSDFPFEVIFRATVTVRDNLGDVIGQRVAEFGYIS